MLLRYWKANNNYTLSDLKRNINKTREKKTSSKVLVNSRPFSVERIKLISQCAIIARLYHASNIVDLEKIGSNICCSIVINSVVLFISFHFIYVFGFSVSERESWRKHNETFIRRKWIQYMDFKCKSMPTIATLNDNIKNENDEFTPLFRYIDDRLGYRIGFIISLIRIHTHTHL